MKKSVRPTVGHGFSRAPATLKGCPTDIRDRPGSVRLRYCSSSSKVSRPTSSSSCSPPSSGSARPVSNAVRQRASASPLVRPPSLDTCGVASSGGGGAAGAASVRTRRSRSMVGGVRGRDRRADAGFGAAALGRVAGAFGAAVRRGLAAARLARAALAGAGRALWAVGRLLRAAFAVGFARVVFLRAPGARLVDGRRGLFRLAEDLGIGGSSQI